MSEDPVYTIRYSSRAKRVSLRMSPERGLEVVLPRGADAARVPDFVRRKRAWIEKQTRRLAERRGLLLGQPLLPEQIPFRAVCEVWQVRYVDGSGAPRLTMRRARGVLVVSGADTDEQACRRHLLAWLHRQGKRCLIPWLEALGQEYGLAYGSVSIRRQKTRWGSYSARGNVSLNCKLLFLPASLTRHVLIHELCHSRYMNHSARFWRLVTALDPDTASSRVALRDAWRYVPRWAQEPVTPQP